MYFHELGHSNRDIAKRCGTTRKTVARWISRLKNNPHELSDLSRKSKGSKLSKRQQRKILRDLQKDENLSIRKLANMYKVSSTTIYHNQRSTRAQQIISIQIKKDIISQ